jgi:5-hydroxyisourate hydrolase
MSPITTHVLDTSRGAPASGIVVILEVPDRDAAGADGWTELARGTTSVDGRINDFHPSLDVLKPGILRLRFATGDYFAATGTATFYPEVHVVIQIADPAKHHHIPLLLSPFGYSTYRGS